MIWWRIWSWQIWWRHTGLKRLQGHVQGLQSLMQLMMVKGGLKLKGGRLIRGGKGGNARSLRLQQLRLRRRNVINGNLIMMIMASLRNITVTAVNITLATGTGRSKTVTPTPASLREIILHLPTPTSRGICVSPPSAATARIATAATTATAKSRRAPK